MVNRQPSSPFAKKKTQSLQFSVKTILLVMMVCAVACSVIVAALRTPDIASEIAVWTGGNTVTSSSGRYTHLVFLLLCYCSTMMLALLVQVATRINNWYLSREAERVNSNEPQDPFADA